MYRFILLFLICLTCAGCGTESATTTEPQAAGNSASEATEAAGRGPASNAGSGDRGLPGDPEAGAAIYTRICVGCHAADGRGNGGVTGADFVGDETRLSKTNEELLSSIRDGLSTGSMPMPPQRDNLSEQEMKDVLSYIRDNFGQDA